jgi:hypothetical protein
VAGLNNTTMNQRLSKPAWFVLCLMALLCAPLQAQTTTPATPSNTAQGLGMDLTWSGFATLGYAQSDSDYSYQRFINKKGGFNRDSLVAGQVDWRITPQWSATLQVKLAPADDSDDKYSAKAAWAFVAWRPGNDWLLRAGKMRLPLYLNSESLDVGVSSDMARLPYEMYSIAPTNDIVGASISRNFSWGEQDITLDAFTGQTDVSARLWLRDGVPPYVPAGSFFKTVNVKISGLILTSRDANLTWRAGLHSVRTRSADGLSLPVSFPRVDVGPGLGYWKVNDSQPGPNIPVTNTIRNLAFTLGGEWQVDPTWRVAAEFVRMRQLDTEVGSDSKAGYVAVFKRFGSFTPYVSWARQRSSDGILEWQRRLTQDQLPAFIPGAAQNNAIQRVAGESLYAFDQRSVALGLSYALSSTAKIKGEWMQTQVGSASTHFDVPLGQPDAQGLRVNTLTFNVSVAF